jgi:hypothetical protein
VANVRYGPNAPDHVERDEAQPADFVQPDDIERTTPCFLSAMEFSLTCLSLQMVLFQSSKDPPQSNLPHDRITVNNGSSNQTHQIVPWC